MASRKRSREIFAANVGQDVADAKKALSGRDEALMALAAMAAQAEAYREMQEDPRIGQIMVGWGRIEEIYDQLVRTRKLSLPRPSRAK